jgi:hypothetical protein
MTLGQLSCRRSEGPTFWGCLCSYGVIYLFLLLRVVLFSFLDWISLCYTQAGLELLSSSNLPASASPIARTTGVTLFPAPVFFKTWKIVLEA